MSDVVVGIDPGNGGGIAVVGPVSSVVAKMPETEADLLTLMRATAEMSRIAFLEHVQPGGLHRGRESQDGKRRTMGAKSAYTFGYGNGTLKMALLACGFRIEMVRPQQWQKALGCLSRGDKNVTKRKAQELFPGVHVTHAVADALLIAEYGRRKIAGNL